MFLSQVNNSPTVEEKVVETPEPENKVPPLLINTESKKNFLECTFNKVDKSPEAEIRNMLKSVSDYMDTPSPSVFKETLRATSRLNVLSK